MASDAAPASVAPTLTLDQIRNYVQNRAYWIRIYDKPPVHEELTARRAQRDAAWNALVQSWGGVEKAEQDMTTDEKIVLEERRQVWKEMSGEELIMCKNLFKGVHWIQNHDHNEDKQVGDPATEMTAGVSVDVRQEEDGTTDILMRPFPGFDGEWLTTHLEGEGLMQGASMGHSRDFGKFNFVIHEFSNCEEGARPNTGLREKVDLSDPAPLAEKPRVSKLSPRIEFQEWEILDSGENSDEEISGLLSPAQADEKTDADYSDSTSFEDDILSLSSSSCSSSAIVSSTRSRIKTSVPTTHIMSAPAPLPSAPATGQAPAPSMPSAGVPLSNAGAPASAPAAAPQPNTSAVPASPPPPLPQGGSGSTMDTSTDNGNHGGRGTKRGAETSLDNLRYGGGGANAINDPEQAAKAFQTATQQMSDQEFAKATPLMATNAYWADEARKNKEELQRVAASAKEKDEVFKFTLDHMQEKLMDNMQKFVKVGKGAKGYTPDVQAKFDYARKLDPQAPGYGVRLVQSLGDVLSEASAGIDERLNDLRKQRQLEKKQKLVHGNPPALPQPGAALGGQPQQLAYGHPAAFYPPPLAGGTGAAPAQGQNPAQGQAPTQGQNPAVPPPVTGTGVTAMASTGTYGTPYLPPASYEAGAMFEARRVAEAAFASMSSARDAYTRTLHMGKASHEPFGWNPPPPSAPVSSPPAPSAAQGVLALASTDTYGSTAPPSPQVPQYQPSQLQPQPYGGGYHQPQAPPPQHYGGGGGYPQQQQGYPQQYGGGGGYQQQPQLGSDDMLKHMWQKEHRVALPNLDRFGLGPDRILASKFTTDVNPQDVSAASQAANGGTSATPVSQRVSSNGLILRH